MFSSMPLKEFVELTASDAPAPGGGSVAAIAGSLAAALAAMVGRLTCGREKYRAAWPALEPVIRDGDCLAARLLQLAVADTRAFEACMAARKLPKTTPDEQQQRSTAMAAADAKAAQVPLETLEVCGHIARLALVAVEQGNPNAVTDAGSAALLAEAGARAASYNVLVNLPGLDPATATATRERVRLALADITACTGRAAEMVLRAVQ